MKPLIIIIKTLVIGYLWSIVFIDGIRVLLLIQWHFDIFLPEHWTLLKYKWSEGFTLNKSAIGFFMILISSVPLWFVGWIGLCMMKWQRMLKYLIFGPLYLYRKLTLKKKAPIVIKKKTISTPVKDATKTDSVEKPTKILKKVPKKKAPLPSVALMQSNINANMANSMTSRSTSNYGKPLKDDAPLNHALFNFDEDDFDLDFDFDTDKKDDKQELDNKIPSALVVDEEKTAVKEPEPQTNQKQNTNNNQASNKKNNKKNKTNETQNNSQNNANKESHTPVLDVLNQKGYDVISSAVIKGNKIDYIGVSDKQLILCMIDKETGDWLADEEKFNDEEPLWFSESSHRVSPLRKMDIARDVLKTKLAVGDLNFEIVSYVIINAGYIINAEDMFDIWKEMNINVTRINRGSPKEISLFSKSLEACEVKTDKGTLDKLKKLIRSMV